MKKFIVFALLLVAGCSTHHAQCGSEAVSNDSNDVIAVATRLFVCTDSRDWSCVRDVFAPEVLFDRDLLRTS